MAKNALAQKTLERIRGRLTSVALPAVGRIIQLIHDLTSRAEDLSVEELAEMVSREPRILTRIIAVANTLGYNPQGIPIEEIHQAIQTIGFEKVRNLTVSLTLVENAEGQLHPEESLESASLALASGLFAREIAQKEGTVDPELGFVCSVLRNYGRLLMALFLAEDYRESRALALEMDQDESYQAVFGLTPVELTFHLFRAEQLPPALQSTLQNAPSYVVTTAAFSHEDELVALSDLAMKLCELVDQKDLTADNFTARAEALIQDVCATQRLTGADAVAFVGLIRDHLVPSGGGKAAGLSASPLVQRIDALATGKPLPPPLAPRPRRTVARSPSDTAAPIDRNGTASNPSSLPAPDPVVSPDKVLTDGIRRLEELLLQRGTQPAQVFECATELLCSGLSLLHCLVFVPDSPGSPLYARYGKGEVFAQQRNRPMALGTGKDVIAVALTRGEDVLIENPSDRRIRSFIPDWLLAAAPEHPIVLLPVQLGSAGRGIICGVSRDRKAFESVAKVAAQTQQLRAVLAGVMTRSLRAP